uniref:Uncharacterized protein n=1 Tax=Anguilla anguilla TaxID=7936 RepID=A0A0E9WIY4_ANGAN
MMSVPWRLTVGKKTECWKKCSVLFDTTFIVVFMVFVNASSSSVPHLHFSCAYSHLHV